MAIELPGYAALFAAIGALLLGPLLLQLARFGPRVAAFLDGFTFISIAGLFCFSVFPAALAAGGSAAWAFAALGLVFPVAAERLFRRTAARAHLAILGLGVAGLAAHAVLDGIALMGAGLVESDHGHAGEDLAVAVVLHNLPKGLAIWYLLQPAFGTRVAVLAFAALVAATAGGFLGGPAVVAALAGPAMAWFQAFIVGSILHVVMHGPAHHEPAQVRIPRWAERLGLICGLLLLYIYL